MTYSAVRSSRGRGMAGTALIRLLTCDSISRTLRLVDSCLDAIWSMTRGMSTWRKRSSLTSSVNPSAVRALLSAASSSASVGAGDAISDALRFRSVVTILRSRSGRFQARCECCPVQRAQISTLDPTERPLKRSHEIDFVSHSSTCTTRCPGYRAHPRIYPSRSSPNPSITSPSRRPTDVAPVRSLTPPCSREPPWLPCEARPSSIQPRLRQTSPSP